MRQSGMQVPWSSLRRCDREGSKPSRKAFSTRCMRELRVAGDLAVREGLHPRLGRAFVGRADADADGGIVIEEEVRPVVGRDRDEHVRPRRARRAGRAPGRPFSAAISRLGGTASHSRTRSGPWLAAKAPAKLAIAQLADEFLVLHAGGEEVVAQQIGVGAPGEKRRIVFGRAFLTRSSSGYRANTACRSCLNSAASAGCCRSKNIFDSQ